MRGEKKMYPNRIQYNKLIKNMTQDFYISLLKIIKNFWIQPTFKTKVINNSILRIFHR